MSSGNPAARWHFLFKGALFALLAVNTAAYGISGTPSEALDSVAWLSLLVSFELETGRAQIGRGSSSRVVLRGVRLLAGLALAAAAIGYVRGSAWFDAINVGLWIGVVALLELEVRCPGIVNRHRVGFMIAATALYAGLVALVLAWLLRGEWFDAYDAALWLVAFATLEMDLVGRFRGGRPAT